MKRLEVILLQLNDFSVCFGVFFFFVCVHMLHTARFSDLFSIGENLQAHCPPHTNLFPTEIPNATCEVSHCPAIWITFSLRYQQN